MKKIKVFPSIFGGNFGRLEEEAKNIEASGGDGIHIDIMDGHFVPNLTIGPKAVSAINDATNLFLDVHIMAYNPFSFIEEFVKAGADRITIHFEATEEVRETLSYIKKCNIEAGLAFSPETPIDFACKLLDVCDLILVMSVNPGFCGQGFIEDSLDRIAFLREFCSKNMITKKKLIDGNIVEEEFPIQVDGGINNITGKQCVLAGASELVSAGFLFDSGNMKNKIVELRELK